MLSREMQHPEPQHEGPPVRDHIPAPQTEVTGNGRVMLVLLGSLAVATGIMWGVISLPGFEDSQAVPTPITAPALETAVAPRPQAPAPIDAALRPQTSQSLMQKVQPSEVERAIESMLIPDADKLRLRSEVASDDTRIAWIAVSDWDFQDGDWVTVTGAGYSQNIRLFHAPTTVAVPYRQGIPVTVTGHIDGDNRGITAAVHVGGGRFPLAHMRIGTSVQVPTP